MGQPAGKTPRGQRAPRILNSRRPGAPGGGILSTDYGSDAPDSPSANRRRSWRNINWLLLPAFRYGWGTWGWTHDPNFRRNANDFEREGG